MTLFPQHLKAIFLRRTIRFLIRQLLIKAGYDHDVQQAVNRLTEPDQTSEDGDATGS